MKAIMRAAAKAGVCKTRVAAASAILREMTAASDRVRVSAEVGVLGLATASVAEIAGRVRMSVRLRLATSRLNRAQQVMVAANYGMGGKIRTVQVRVALLFRELLAGCGRRAARRYQPLGPGAGTGAVGYTGFRNGRSGGRRVHPGRSAAAVVVNRAVLRGSWDDLTPAGLL
ncbi:hypothetical protein [Rhodovastum atsumiense]|uniref:Uncharacterized protein n=1 Tax=Rhodovastum atsumiense TaxID=504468 RepID=A0A5M6INK3_9PROT|nr:hypothetical protein [Rhodovastum atsumiense]KAA5609840.1 hypothetical protein F1189_22380 [Rhodovastum atsumiense]